MIFITEFCSEIEKNNEKPTLISVLKQQDDVLKKTVRIDRIHAIADAVC